MAENKKDQGFTPEQLEELRVDALTGGDIPFVGIGSLGIKAGAKVVKEGLEYLAEHSPGWAAKAKELGVDALHRLGTPQNPSAATMNNFKDKLNGHDLTAVVKEQLKAVPGGWAGLGGGSAIAAYMVTSHYENVREEEIAKMPLNEQKAVWFDRSAGAEKREAEALNKFPDLKPYFKQYHSLVEQALKDYPPVGGRSDAASSAIYGGKRELVEQIKNPEAEKRSSVDGLSVQEKIALIDQQISTMPEHQQEAMRQTVANNMNANGIGIMEAESNQQQIERT